MSPDAKALLWQPLLRRFNAGTIQCCAQGSREPRVNGLARGRFAL